MKELIGGLLAVALLAAAGWIAYQKLAAKNTQGPPPPTAGARTAEAAMGQETDQERTAPAATPQTVNETPEQRAERLLKEAADLWDRGEMEAAIDASERALAIRKALYPPDDPRIKGLEEQVVKAKLVLTNKRLDELAAQMNAR